MPHTQMLEGRLRFLQIDDDTLAELRNAKNLLEPAMDRMLDRFYSHILGEKELKSLFADQESIDRARAAQKEHWLNTLFEGMYDNAYFEKAAQIGRAHARVGLSPNWYIGGYCQMLGQFIDLISAEYAESNKSTASIIQAVCKIVFLDMDVVIHCYLDAKDSSMREILRRATHFTADVTELTRDLGTTSTQINTTAESLSQEAKDSAGQASIADQVETLLAQAELLNLQTAQLNERLEELQFGDRLYFADADRQPGVIAHLKSLLRRR